MLLWAIIMPVGFISGCFYLGRRMGFIKEGFVTGCNISEGDLSLEIRFFLQPLIKTIKLGADSRS